MPLVTQPASSILASAGPPAHSLIADADLQSAVDQLLRLDPTFRAIKPPVEKVTAVRQAAARLTAAVARERGAEQPVLTIAFAGATGAGKSTLINSLARSRITRVLGRAAATRQAHVYHHRQTPLGGLPREVALHAVLVPHDRPELYAKVLIDTPDLDTAVLTNRQTTKAVLKAATLVLYVFTPEKYAEERVWSVIEQEKRFSAFAAVLNKSDRVSPDELEKITEDLRSLFAARGAADVRIFRTQANRHEPDEAGALPPPFPDDFAALRAFIEQELQKADIVRMARRQRRAALGAVREAVDAIASPDASVKLDNAADLGARSIEDAADALARQWRGVFAAAEDAVLPAAKRRYHERFRGPIRAWFALWDGLAGIGAKLSGKPADTLDLTDIGAALSADRHAVDDQLNRASQKVQDQLHADGLPVNRWTATVARPASDAVTNHVAAAVEASCRQQALACSPGKAKLATVVSALSALLVAAIVVFGAYRFSVDLYYGQHEKAPLLVLNVVCLTALSMVGLHLLVGLRGTTGSASVSGAGRQACGDALAKVMNGWIKSYRSDLDADLALVREPLTTIEKAYAEEGAADEPEVEPPALEAVSVDDILPSQEDPAPPLAASIEPPSQPADDPPQAPSNAPALSPGKKKGLADYLKDLG